MMGLGCAGAIPSLQRASDFVHAHPGSVSLVLAVEMCSACYYVDDTLETVVGNAICADGAAAFLLTRGPVPTVPLPAIVDFESFLYPDHLQTVGLDHRNGKLRIILGSEVSDLAAPLIEGALTRCSSAMACHERTSGSGSRIRAGARCWTTCKRHLV